MTTNERDEIVTALLARAAKLEAQADAMQPGPERVQRYGEADGMRMAASLVQERPVS